MSQEPTGSMPKPKSKSIVPHPLSNVTPEAEPEPEVEVEPVRQRAGYLLTCAPKAAEHKHQKAAGRSATATCEPPYQKHLPTAEHHATEGRTSPRIARKDA